MRAIFLPLILLLTPSLQAGSTRDITCRFIKMEAGKELTSVLVASENGGEIKSPIRTNTLSAEIICPATDNEIAFVSGDDKSPVATAKIPENLKSALLIFYKTKATAEKAEKGEAEEGEAEEGEAEEGEAEESSWEILIVDDSGKKAGKGGVLVANCNLTEVRCTIGSEEQLMSPLETRYFEMPKDRDDFNMALVKLESHVGDRWKVIRENSLRFLPGTRYMVVSFPDSRSGRPRANILQDSK